MMLFLAVGPLNGGLEHSVVVGATIGTHEPIAENTERTKC